MQSGSRVRVLLEHLRPGGNDADSSELVVQPCASSSWSLPRFDVEAMESFLDEFRDLKAEVYGKLEQHPELLLPTLEGLSKGAKSCPVHHRWCLVPALALQYWKAISGSVIGTENPTSPVTVHEWAYEAVHQL